MHTSPDVSSSRPGFPHARIGTDAPLECDFCGCAVHRELAYEHVRHGDDGVEVVFVCSDCELGSD